MRHYSETYSPQSNGLATVLKLTCLIPRSTKIYRTLENFQEKISKPTQDPKLNLLKLIV